MKKFNKQIQVTVEVDQIATQLLASFSDENPHKEMMTETIIDSMLQSGHISMLYNNLNGWTNELNFTVGQYVDCKESQYTYEPQISVDDSVHYERKYKTIETCLIKEINIFRLDDVLVEFESRKSNGDIFAETKWVKHDTLLAREID